jgi:hypothetical protein
MRRFFYGLLIVLTLPWISAAEAQVSVQIGEQGDLQVFTNGNNVSILDGQVLTNNSNNNTVIQRSYSYQSSGYPYRRPYFRKHRTIVRSGSGIVDQSVLIDVR